MALILYPTDDYDAFISIVNCDAFLTANVIGSQRTLYDALEDVDKEIYIRQATTLIEGRITLPDTLEQDLQDATAYLVNYSVGLDMLNADKSSNVKVKNIVGVISTEYFATGAASNSFPDVVTTLLGQYGLIARSSFALDRSWVMQQMQ